MVCTKLDAGYCKVIAATCPKKYEVKMVTYRKCPIFGKTPVKVAKAKTKVSKKLVARKVKKVSSKRRRR